MRPYDWPLVDEFINRTDELDHMERWWSSSTREPLTLIGRRRVGKSWLFRRFAHRKPAVLLVSEQLPPGAQLSRFAEQLEPLVGARPDLPDVQTLFRVLFRAARDEKILVVIDEFPWLLGSSSPEALRTLSSIQAAMEDERDASQLKLLLCGSQVGLMESLFREKNPMHGRMERFAVRPLSFGDAAKFFPAEEPIAAFVRYAITGGMPMYLARMTKPKLRDAVCAAVLDRDAPLWNEGRALVEQELREPRVYFAVLEQLASGAKDLNEIAQRGKIETNVVGRYLSTLIDLRLVSKRIPLGAPEGSRVGRWQLDDPFLRFWFRFVFPFQFDLEAGLSAQGLYDSEVVGTLPEHVATVFESWCTEWLRANRPQLATRYGPWWGNSAGRFRRSKERFSEEIDVVGIRRGKVSAVAEAKWTNKALTPKVLEDLERYKIPALRESNLRVADDPTILLFSRSGYTKSLREMAADDARIELVDVPRELAQEANRP